MAAFCEYAFLLAGFVMTKQSELSSKVEQAQNRIFDTLIPFGDDRTAPLGEVSPSVKPSARITAAMDIIAANPEKYSDRAIEYMQHQHDASERMSIVNSFARILGRLPSDARLSLIDAAEDSLYMDNRATGRANVSAIQFLGRAHQFMTISQRDAYTKLLTGRSRFDKWTNVHIGDEDRAALRQMEYREIAREFHEHREKEKMLDHSDYEKVINDIVVKHEAAKASDLLDVVDLSRDASLLSKVSDWLVANEKVGIGGDIAESRQGKRQRLHQSSTDGREGNREPLDRDSGQRKIDSYFKIARSARGESSRSIRGVLDPRNRSRSSECR